MAHLTPKQKSRAWSDAADLLSDLCRPCESGKTTPEDSHIMAVVIPHLRAMAERIRRNDPKRKRAKSPPR